MFECDVENLLKQYQEVKESPDSKERRERLLEIEVLLLDFLFLRPAVGGLRELAKDR